MSLYFCSSVPFVVTVYVQYTLHFDLSGAVLALFPGVLVLVLYTVVCSLKYVGRNPMREQHCFTCLKAVVCWGCGTST
jgi:hypothetical protein